jgi:polar amino acid transport system substrate-binding protein
MLGKGSELTGPVNEAISALKEDGTLAAIYEKHLGVSPDEGTSTVTVLPLPSAE